MSLTSEGEKLLARCRPALEQLREAEAELTSSSQRPSGKLRVSLPAIGYHLLMPFSRHSRRNIPISTPSWISATGW